MIGKACRATLSYYDRIDKKQKFKSRPCLVIGQADSGDYVILPISSITDKSRVDVYYDIRLDNSVFTFLKKVSYLRAHKQTVVNIANLKGPYIDFKGVYSETYLEAISKVEEFQRKMISNAL